MEALKLGTKLAVGTQVLLEHADDLLSFEPTSSAAPGATAMARQSSFGEAYHAASHSDDTKGRSTRKYPASKYGQQPADFGEGIELAYDSMRRNVGSAAHTIFAIPMEVYEQKGAQGTVKAVVRAVPVAVLRPMIGASEAFSKTLMGLQNTIDPMQRLQMEDVSIQQLDDSFSLTYSFRNTKNSKYMLVLLIINSPFISLNLMDKNLTDKNLTHEDPIHHSIHHHNSRFHNHQHSNHPHLPNLQLNLNPYHPLFNESN
jgi:hypothetical protein